MGIDKKILEEIARYKSINNYITEQELPAPPAADPMADPTLPPADDTLAPVDPAMAPPANTTPPPAPAQPIDVATDPEVEKVGEEENKEELDITDLVKTQKNVEQKQEEYFETLFNHLNNLESKLGEMDNIVSKLNDLETKVEKYRTKTPEEKLELRSLDSGPFNQKLSQYFEDKEDDFEKLGRDEYILTQDDVEDFSHGDIKKSFRDFEDEDGIIDIK